MDSVRRQTWQEEQGLGSTNPQLSRHLQELQEELAETKFKLRSEIDQHHKTTMEWTQERAKFANLKKVVSTLEEFMREQQAELQDRHQSSECLKAQLSLQLSEATNTINNLYATISSLKDQKACQMIQVQNASTQTDTHQADPADWEMIN